MDIVGCDELVLNVGYEQIVKVSIGFFKLHLGKEKMPIRDSINLVFLPNYTEVETQ